MPNPFTPQSVIRVHIYSNTVVLERLNCMPKTPEIYYPGSQFYTYRQIFDTVQIERDLNQYGLSTTEIRQSCESLFDVPSGTSVTLRRKDT